MLEHLELSTKGVSKQATFDSSPVRQSFENVVFRGDIPRNTAEPLKETRRRKEYIFALTWTETDELF
jgi:hypothetical protein